MGGFLSQTQCAKFAKLVVFWKIWPVGIVMGHKNHASQGIKVVEILKSTLSIPVQFFLKNPHRHHFIYGNIVQTVNNCFHLEVRLTFVQHLLLFAEKISLVIA